MHRSRSPFLPLAIAASSLASCASPAERAAVGESREVQRAAVAMPDSRFGGGRHGVQFYESDDGRLAMRATHDMEGQILRISHRYSYDPVMRSGPQVETVEPVGFWPTQATKFSNGELCVAGVDPRTGNTILEVWSFTLPKWVSGYRERTAAKVEPGVVAERRRIFDAASDGMRGVLRVHSMTTARGTGGHLLVQFFDSRDVHTLDVATGKTKRVASPIEHADCATIPLLARELNSQSRRHPIEGALYILSESGAPDTQTSIVVLRDTDLNGTIDGTAMMRLDDYRAAGYMDPEALVR